MTQDRARQLLATIWGLGHQLIAGERFGYDRSNPTMPKPITAEMVVLEIQAVELPGESVLDTLQRIAGDTWDFHKYGPAASRTHFLSLVPKEGFAL